MRRPRDYDAELKVLTNKAKHLKDRKILQLGEVAIASGADQMPVEQLAGALLAAAENKDATTTEAWRKRGAAFFQEGSPRSRGAARSDSRCAQAPDSSAASS